MASSLSRLGGLGKRQIQVFSVHLGGSVLPPPDEPKIINLQWASMVKIIGFEFQRVPNKNQLLVLFVHMPAAAAAADQR